MNEVKIIEDSVSPAGARLTTFQLRYWRAFHAEVLTHRDFSRGAGSSRAIPVSKLLEQVRADPAMTMHWGANQPGMQADQQLTGDDLDFVIAEWRAAANSAAYHAERMMERGLHKQVANRVLEPFCNISVIVTSTNWDNFFRLRCDKAALPDLEDLADKMKAAMEASDPIKQEGWHLPYITAGERLNFDPALLAKVSAGRCARVSYENHDGTAPIIEKDLALFSRLIESAPEHAGPCEHQAIPADYRLARSRNFVGWVQHRDILGV